MITTTKSSVLEARSRPLLAVVGPTASGKTNLALSLAEQFNGEIICADSRTLYRGMDIGTAKPTAAEQRRVPHHLLDVRDPGDTLSAAQFKALALDTITEISNRGRLPLLVGGSGLYIDAVLYDYQFPGVADAAKRAELETLDTPALQARAAAADPEAFAAMDQVNRRRLIRLIETAHQPRAKAAALRSRTLVLGLAPEPAVLAERINRRIEKMLEEGFLAEVQQIGSTYGWESEALSSIGYRAFRGVVQGDKTVAEGAADFARGDRQLAKKQLTWFRRNSDIRWLASPAEAAPLVAAFLAE